MAETFEITRVFSATPARVWQAWTEPEELARWLSPKGVKSDVKHFDLRPGGYVHTRMEAPDGTISWGRYSYREIDAPSRLVWEQGFSNETAEFVAAPFPMPWPLKMLTTVIFDAVAEGTRVTLCWEPINPTDAQRASFVAMLPNMSGGWTGTFDQFDALLAGVG